MPQSKIAVVVGSLRKDSINLRLAQALAKLAPAELSLKIAPIADLPLYSQDDDASPAEPVKRFRAEISSAQGVLFVTPEHNRSIPGALKNALDTASRPYGHNVWAGKPAGIVGASPGKLGTALAQQHLRNVLAFLDMPTLGQNEAFIQIGEDYFDAQGDIADPANKRFLQGWMDRYAQWVKKHLA
jgi:chromate reductase